MKHIRYSRFLLCCILLCFLGKTGYSQVVVSADSTGCSSTSVTLHATIIGDVPTSSGITADDGWSGVIPIGFTFNFYGTNNTQCIIGSNGCVGFTLSNAGAYNTWPISATLASTTSSDIVNCICGPWCDMYIPAGGTITYSTVGTAPNRRFAVTYCHDAMYSCTTQFTTTQIILYETSNLAEVHVAHHTFCTSWNGGYAIIGVKQSIGGASTVAPGRDYPAIWSVTDEAWRFTQNGAGTAYTVASIPYAPIPYASSTIYWYDSATHAYLGSGPSITLSPTVPTTYVAAALGCSDTSFGYIHVMPPGGVGGGSGVGLHITNSTYTNPTACGMCDGTITLNGITPGQIDTLFYTYNGVSQTPTVHTTGADSTITLTGLCAGVYSSMYVKVGGCYSNAVGDSLTAPVLAVQGDSAVNPTICGDNDGHITLWGLFPGQPATVTMILNGTTTVTRTGTVDATGSITFTDMLAGTYSSIVVTEGLCSATANPLVLVNPPITAAFNTNVTHLGCTSDTLFCTNLSTPAGFTSYWTFGDGSAVDSTDTNPMHVYSAQGAYTVTLVYSTFHTCYDTISQSILFNHPLTSVFTSSASQLCLGTPVSFTNSSVGLAPTYLWAFGDGTTSTDMNPVHTYVAGGIYAVTLQVTDSIHCVATSTANEEVIDVHVRTDFHDTSVCLRDSLPLINYVTIIPEGSQSGVSYSWAPTNNIGDPNADTAKFMGIGNYTYTLTVTSVPLGCVATDALSIHSYPPVTLAGVTASQSIPNGTSIQLNAIGATYYTWTPDNGTLDNTNINNPVATPVDSVTTYVVHGMSLYGCLDSAEVTIHLDYDGDVFIPMAFSPNNDGLNDNFRLSNMKHHTLVEMRVFDRWGKEVFHTNSAEKGWDGSLNGTPQDIGVYNYQVIVANPDGQQKTISGNVTLIR